MNPAASIPVLIPDLTPDAAWSDLLVVAAAAAAAALVVTPLPTPPVPAAATPRRIRSGSRIWPTALILAPAVVLLNGRTLAWALLIGLTAMIVTYQWRAQRARHTQARIRGEVGERIDQLAAELVAGVPAATAVDRVAREWPLLARVAEAIRMGADVPAAFTQASRTAGAADLRLVASAWQVATQTGQSLATAIAATAAGIRTGERARAAVDAELASARATAQMVAGLPVLALSVGAGMGGDPWGFLLTTPVGLGCLGAGIGLIGAGMAWIDRIAAAVVP